MVTITELKKSSSNQQTKKEKKSFPTAKKRKPLKSFDQKLENPSTQKENRDSIESLKQQLARLKEENKFLKKGSKLTKNEEKILTAIRNEKIEQGTDKPIISTSMLRKKYKVSAKYQGESTKNLIEKSIIQREEVSYSGAVKTFRWQILRH
jgi:hypothetical protein